MQDVLLIVAVAVIFAFGWFLMGKVDCFLEANHHARELGLLSSGNTLRLGFCNPMAADSITDGLEQYSKLHPDISVRIFCGSEGDLLNGFSAGRFDVIFLPENAEIPAHIPYGSRIISLNYTPVMMKYGGLPIEPVTDGHIIQHVLWIGEAASAFAGCVRRCLEDNFPASAQAK